MVLTVRMSSFTDTDTFSWQSLAALAGSTTTYEVLRGDIDALPVGGNGEVCFVPEGTSFDDATVPANGAGFYSLVRGSNACGIGSFGADSTGNDHPIDACD